MTPFSGVKVFLHLRPATLANGPDAPSLKRTKRHVKRAIETLGATLAVSIAAADLVVCYNGTKAVLNDCAARGVAVVGPEYLLACAAEKTRLAMEPYCIVAAHATVATPAPHEPPPGGAPPRICSTPYLDMHDDDETWDGDDGAGVATGPPPSSTRAAGPSPPLPQRSGTPTSPAQSQVSSCPVSTSRKKRKSHVQWHDDLEEVVRADGGVALTMPPCGRRRHATGDSAGGTSDSEETQDTGGGGGTIAAGPPVVVQSVSCDPFDNVNHFQFRSAGTKAEGMACVAAAAHAAEVNKTPEVLDAGATQEADDNDQVEWIRCPSRKTLAEDHGGQGRRGGTGHSATPTAPAHRRLPPSGVSASPRRMDAVAIDSASTQLSMSFTDPDLLEPLNDIPASLADCPRGARSTASRSVVDESRGRRSRHRVEGATDGAVAPDLGGSRHVAEVRVGIAVHLPRPNESSAGEYDYRDEVQATSFARSSQMGRIIEFLTDVVTQLGGVCLTEFFGRARKPTHLVVVERKDAVAGPPFQPPTAVVLARAHGIPILTPQWLYDGITLGAFPKPIPAHWHAVFGRVADRVGGESPVRPVHAVLGAPCDEPASAPTPSQCVPVPERGVRSRGAQRSVADLEHLRRELLGRDAEPCHGTHYVPLLDGMTIFVASAGAAPAKAGCPGPRRPREGLPVEQQPQRFAEILRVLGATVTRNDRCPHLEAVFVVPCGEPLPHGRDVPIVSVGWLVDLLWGAGSRPGDHPAATSRDAVVEPDLRASASRKRGRGALPPQGCASEAETTETAAARPPRRPRLPRHDADVGPRPSPRGSPSRVQKLSAEEPSTQELDQLLRTVIAGASQLV